MPESEKWSQKTLDGKYDGYMRGLDGAESENVENVQVLSGFFERARGHLAVTKGKGQIPKRKFFKIFLEMCSPPTQEAQV